MIRLLVSALFLAGLLAQQALAQTGRKPFSAMSAEEKANAKIAESVDAQYRNAIKNTDNTANEISVDPWSNMRGTETPKKKK
ncbi:MAG: hypothetical protein JSR61_21140 [Proteobacteria bacterium]|nr:hypothetical protein [Pseudomonadota bacterium]